MRGGRGRCAGKGGKGREGGEERRGRGEKERKGVTRRTNSNLLPAPLSGDAHL